MASSSYSTVEFLGDSVGDNSVIYTTTAPDLTNSTGGVFAAPYSTSSMLYLYKLAPRRSIKPAFGNGVAEQTILVPYSISSRQVRDTGTATPIRSPGFG